jgi:hypothetical protein
MQVLPRGPRSWLVALLYPLVVTLCSVGLLLGLDRPLGFAPLTGLELSWFVLLSLASGVIPARWLHAMHERQGAWSWLAVAPSLAGAVAGVEVYRRLFIGFGGDLGPISLTSMFWKWAHEPEGSMFIFVLFVALVALLDFVWLVFQVLAARFAVYLGMIFLPALGLVLGMSTYTLARRVSVAASARGRRRAGTEVPADPP